MWDRSTGEFVRRPLGAHAAGQRKFGEIRAEGERMVRNRGGVDIVFANAEIQAFKPLLDMSDFDWNDQIDVNLTGCTAIETLKNVTPLGVPWVGPGMSTDDQRHVILGYRG
jgi:NAD(P)-dependent dehydrogenase (short-subunit alcohol dehydrogenase family)